MSHRSPLRSGSEPFPGYRLKRLCGKGGFAEVWEAEGADGSLRALKFIALNRGTLPISEIKYLQAIQRIEHSGILKMEKICSIPDYIVILMELADGSMLELFDAYQQEYRTAIPPLELCAYLSQAAQAVDFLNQRQHTIDGRRVGIQHCDLKPSNLLLVGETVKLADFGMSTPTQGPYTPYNKGGTVDFAAPEVHRGQLTDRSDQYGFAITYYFLRTGKFPFPPAPKVFERTQSYLRQSPDLSQVSEREAWVLSRALAMEPEHRWDSCYQMVLELESCFKPVSARAGGSHFGDVKSPVSKMAGTV